MKKIIRPTLCAAVVLFLGFSSFNSFAGWDYKSDVSLDRIDGKLYLVTHCEDKIGDDCTTAGSASRIDISWLSKLRIPRL